MADSGQTYSNHTRFFPMFHFFVFPVLAINMLLALWGTFRAPSVATIWGVIVSAALVVLALAARLMALAVQDRVIRMEMRLRLKELLPAELQPRINQLSRQQFVALRFASDAELPELTRQVLAGSLATTADIKKAIRSWQGDYLRA